MYDHVETEWQFECAAPPQRWLRRAELPAGFTLGAPVTDEIADTYYDTEDWRLHRAGYALRVRATGRARAVTMKQVAAARDGRHERRELTMPLARGRVRAAEDGDCVRRAIDRVGGPLAARVGAVVGAHPLRPIAELRTRRRRMPIMRGGRVVGELALDVTTIPLDGASVPAHVRRVEVEVAAGAAAADLAPLVDTWRRDVMLAPTDESKLETALRVRGLAPPAVAELGPCAIDDGMTAGAVALALLRRDFADVLQHEPGTRLGDDPEALHDMRVAIRRLRATLALFAQALPRRAAAHRATLASIAGALGEVRDVDVQLARMDGWRAGMDPAAAAELSRLADVLRRSRAAARRRMLRVLDSARYGRFIGRFTAMLRGTLPRAGMARRPIVAIAPALVRARMRKMRSVGDDVGATSPAAAYHALRIRCKKLRYALDAHAELYGKPVRRLAVAVTKLQDLLGRHQDAQVAIVDLRELCERARPRLSARAVFVIGTIAARYEREAQRLRRRFPKRYAAVVRRWKKARRALAARHETGVRAPAPAVEVAGVASGATIVPKTGPDVTASETGASRPNARQQRAERDGTHGAGAAATLIAAAAKRRGPLRHRATRRPSTSASR